MFAGYLLVIFPLTFVVMSQRLLRFISAALATAGLTLLLVDSEVFSHFHLHLNPVVWDLVVNPDQSELSRDWQLMFICVPVLFPVEMLFGTGAGKAAQPEPPPFRQAAGGAVYQRLFASHLIYIWADANFYRPITMQRANLPLSYPMTARKFLENTACSTSKSMSAARCNKATRKRWRWNIRSAISATAIKAAAITC